MIIAVDLDETLVNLVDKWAYYYNQRYGTNVTREDMTEYGSVHSNDWIDFLRIPGFHADLPWLDPDAPMVLRRLRNDGHRIVIVTSAVAWESARDKYSWVHTHLRIPGLIESMRDLIIARDKGLIRADILIDDNPSALDDFRGKIVVYDQPWNRTYDRADYRVRNWQEVEGVILTQEYERTHESWRPTGCY